MARVKRVIKADNCFLSDLKLCKKQNLKYDEVEIIINKLANDEILEPKYKDHILSGNYKGYRECHIKPDLLLIYCKVNKDLRLIRIGSHSKLFKK